LSLRLVAVIVSWVTEHRMSADDARALMSSITDIGVHARVGGGWGVDALRGAYASAQ